MIGRGWLRAILPIATLPIALIFALNCDPSSPPPSYDPGEIMVDGQAGSTGAGPFVAGAISEDELEELRGAACATLIAEPQHDPSFLELVIDTSGSMAVSPGIEEKSKWVITRETLETAVDALPESIHLGAVFFPNQATPRNCTESSGPCIPGEPLETDACVSLDTVVEMASLGEMESTQRAAFDAALTNVNPAGGTPTHDALELGLAELDSVGAESERFLLLLTDGEPTYLEGCRGSGSAEEPVSVDPILSVIESASSRKIRTFIVAAPGAGPTNVEPGEDLWLSRAAILGGTALEPCDESGPDYCHYDLTDETEFASLLSDTVSSIMAETKACSFRIPEETDDDEVDVAAINVVLHLPGGRAEIVGRGSGPCTEGFRLSEDKEVVELCEDACEVYRSDLVTTPEFIFGCDSAELPIPR